VATLHKGDNNDDDDDINTDAETLVLKHMEVIAKLFS
jgi:hypothetical protein